MFKGSKTDSFGTTAKIVVAATSTPTCPVQAMKIFLRATSDHLPATRPLFTLTTRNYPTRQVLTDRIRSLLQATGITPAQASHYSSHSLHLGRPQRQRQQVCLIDSSKQQGGGGVMPTSGISMVPNGPIDCDPSSSTGEAHLTTGEQ